MPIVDVEVVAVDGEGPQQASIGVLASALGRVFGSPPGRTWVRLRALPANCYAENDAPVPIELLPAFVTVLQASPPAGASLQAEVEAVTQAVADWLGRPMERVHVGYAPAAAGRQAFGGKLVQDAANAPLQPEMLQRASLAGELGQAEGLAAIETTSRDRSDGSAG